MNRTDRLLALVLELRVRRTCRAEDLAQAFNTSKRTIYRDIQALSEAGIPIVALNGRGYQLGEGYFLPPLAFTAEEATLILLGLASIESSFDREYQTIVGDARRKIQGVLSDSIRDHAAALQGSLHLGSILPASPVELEGLRLLRRAIVQQQTVRFRYFSRHPDMVTLRDADPYSLVCLNGIWFMSGYCHLRADRRFFRLTRMQALALTSEHFERPADYQAEQHSERDGRRIVVKVLVADDMAPWIDEDRFFYIEDRQPHPDGVLVTLRVRSIDEVVQWVLGWGRHVRVLEPPELRRRMAEEAAALAANHAG